MRNTIDASKLDLNETIVNIRRVAKTVKGGRNMRFSGAPLPEPIRTSAGFLVTDL